MFKTVFIFLIMNLSILSLSFSKIAETQEKAIKQVRIYEYTEKIKNELEKLKKLNPDDYLQYMQVIRLNLKSYFEHKKRVCQGEFSALILDGKNGPVTQKKTRKKVRLSKKERTLCYLEMKKMQESYILGSYQARKSFLESLHKKKLTELEKVRDISLRNLDKTFN